MIWSSFLLAQHFFARPYRGKPLTWSESLAIGVQASAAVTFACTPFEVLATRKLGENLFNTRNLYRGLPVTFFARTVKNALSALLIARFQET